MGAGSISAPLGQLGSWIGQIAPASGAARFGTKREHARRKKGVWHLRHTPVLGLVFLAGELVQVLNHEIPNHAVPSLIQGLVLREVQRDREPAQAVD